MATRAAVPKPQAVSRGSTAFIQGRERRKGSKAYEQAKWVESRRLEKALNQLEHGKHIYAYSHFRTNQVIYSLTRVLDNHKALSQLVFHGKKTVPAALRRDVWAPYFSVHFPHPSQGLAAYRLLREFSLLRQLSPPKELVTTSETLIERLRKRRNPNEVDEWKHPKVGTIMPKKWRAKNLMNQKATSVADVAAVLLIQENEDPVTIDQRKEEKRRRRIAAMSNKGKKRYARRLEEQAKKEAELEQRLIDGKEPRLGLEGYSYMRMSLEHGEDRVQPRGGVNVDNITHLIGDQDAEEIQENEEEGAEDQSTTTANKQVEMYWADLDDAGYAEKWPQYVIHGELERFQNFQGANGRTQRTVHVIARGKGYGEIAPPLPEPSAEREREVRGDAPPVPDGIEPKPKHLFERVKETLLFWRR